MTRAPANLLAVRSLLLEHLDIKDGPASADLESAEVGIVGDPNHRGGYHCGSDRLDADDYSVRESPRDKAGLTLDAAALDVGWFSVRSAGAVHDMRTLATWCVNQCRANTPDSRDIREIIYSPDGKVVHRWDRLGKRTTGDSSHLEHDHFSFFRDAIKAGRDQRPLFTRYLTEIGLLAGEDDDMTPEQEARLWATDARVRTLLEGKESIPAGQTGGPIQITVNKQLRELLDRPAAQFTADQVTALGLQLSEAVTTGPLTVRLPDDQVEVIVGRLADLFAARLKD